MSLLGSRDLERPPRKEFHPRLAVPDSLQVLSTGFTALRFLLMTLPLLLLLEKAMPLSRSSRAVHSGSRGGSVGGTKAGMPSPRSFQVPPEPPWAAHPTIFFRPGPSDPPPLARLLAGVQ